MTNIWYGQIYCFKQTIWCVAGKVKIFKILEGINYLTSTNIYQVTKFWKLVEKPDLSKSSGTKNALLKLRAKGVKPSCVSFKDLQALSRKRGSFYVSSLTTGRCAVFKPFYSFDYNSILHRKIATSLFFLVI